MENGVGAVLGAKVLLTRNLILAVHVAADITQAAIDLLVASRVITSGWMHIPDRATL